MQLAGVAEQRVADVQRGAPAGMERRVPVGAHPHVDAERIGKRGRGGDRVGPTGGPGRTPPAGPLARAGQHAAIRPGWSGNAASSAAS